MSTLVSASIVTYNNEEIIQKCIQSIIDNTKGVELLLTVVDNNSTDNTVDVVKNNFPNVNIVECKENKGFGSGHNIAIRQSKAKYHAVINPDVIMIKDAITALCDYMDENEDTVMITPRVLNDDMTEQYLPKYCPTIRYVFVSKIKPFKYLRRRYTRQEEMLNKPTQVEFCTGCFFVARTSTLLQLDGFDERFFMYCEDADLSRRAREKGKIIFYPETEIIHSWGRDNTRSLRGIKRFVWSLIKYFAKWGFAF